jgi:hypothetical protein
MALFPAMPEIGLQLIQKARSALGYRGLIHALDDLRDGWMAQEF